MGSACKTACLQHHAGCDDEMPIITARIHRAMSLLLILLVSKLPPPTNGQTEGDIGYDARDFYDAEYDSASVLGKEPTFDTPLANASAELGGTALLPCAIDYLGKYKVAWLEQNSIPLTYEERRVIDDSRFSVVRPLVRDWNLQLQDVRLDDAGVYRCTVNTKPVGSKIVSLLVTVAASINKRLSSADVAVKEGRDVIVTCSVFGIPQPEVTWYRLASAARLTDSDEERCQLTSDSSDENVRHHHQQSSSAADWSGYWSRDIALPVRGPSLSFRRVSRFCDDVYECRADNGASSGPVSHRVRLRVQFAPKITLPNRRIGQSPGRQTILECTVTADPQAVTQWNKDDQIITSSSKHKIEAYEEREHTMTFSLRIVDLDAADYGEYECFSANALGTDRQTMTLFEYPEQTYNLHGNTWSQKSVSVAESPSRQSASASGVQRPRNVAKLPAKERVMTSGVRGIFSCSRRHEAALAAAAAAVLVTSSTYLHSL